jgi:hypothetical protein
MHKKIRLI